MSLDGSDITKPVKILEAARFLTPWYILVTIRQVIEKLWRETVRKPTELRKTVKHSEKLEKKSEKKCFR